MPASRRAAPTPRPKVDFTSQHVDVLFRLLIREQISQEISSLRSATTIDTFGHPFCDDNHEIPASAPLLRMLMEKSALPHPIALRLSDDFWKVKMYTFFCKLADPALSDSFDAGAISARTSVATILSTMLVYPLELMVRGYNWPAATARQEYDLNDASHLDQAWRVKMHDTMGVQGVPNLYKELLEQPTLDQLPVDMRAAHRYTLVNIATMLHYVSCLAPSSTHIASSVVKCHQNIRGFYPLAKAALAVTGTAMLEPLVTLFVGVTDSGNNGKTSLFGRLKNVVIGEPQNSYLTKAVSSLLPWDKNAPEKKMKDIKVAESSVTGPVWAALDRYVDDVEFRARCRKTAVENNCPLTVAALERSKIVRPKLKDELSLEKYLQIKLALKNREIFLGAVADKDGTFCRLIKDVLDAGFATLDTIPDVSKDLGDFTGLTQSILGEYTELMVPYLDAIGAAAAAKTSGEDATTLQADVQAKMPSVSQFIVLLINHEQQLHKIVHSIAKKSKDEIKRYEEYTSEIVSSIPVGSEKTAGQDPMPKYSQMATRIVPKLAEKFASLSKEEQRGVMNALDKYADYQQQASQESISLLNDVMKGRKSTFHAGTCIGATTGAFQDIQQLLPNKSEHGEKFKMMEGELLDPAVSKLIVDHFAATFRAALHEEIKR